MKKSLSKRTTGIIFLVIICASFAVYPSHVMAVEKTVIFPIPQQMELSDDPFTLDESVSIIVPAEASDRDLFLARFLVRELSDKYGIALKIESRDDIPEEGKVVVMGAMNNPLIKNYSKQYKLNITEKDPGPEGYFLSVNSDQIVIAGWDDPGAFYGLQSLRQLIDADKGKKVQGIEVRDWPNMPFRAIRLYVPGPDNMAFFNRFLRDFMALYKYNKVVIELNCMRLDRHPEVNAGWIEFADDMIYTRSNRPEGPRGESKNSSHSDAGDGFIIEKRDVRNIVELANENFIEVIPEIPTLTHAYYLLTRHRELSHYPGDIWPDNYCPSLSECYDLTFDVYDEYIEVIQPKMIHIGHDEWRMPIDVCPHCEGKDHSEMFAEDVNKIYDYLSERGIKVAMWGDHLLESVRNAGPREGKTTTGIKYLKPGALPPALVEKSIPKDILIFNWFWTEESRDLEVDDFGFTQVYGNFKPNISNWDERIKNIDVAGGAPSSWAATDEFNIGKDLLTDFLGCANLVWSQHTLNLPDLTKVVVELMPTVRSNLSDVRIPSEDGDPIESIDISSHFNLAKDSRVFNVDLSTLKTGTVKSRNKVFNLQPSTGVSGNCAVAVGSVGTEENPLPQEIKGIPIDADVSSLIFLQACALPANNMKAYFNMPSFFDTPDLLGWYEVIYEDGFKAIVPVQYGVNILEWNPNENGLDRAEGRTGSAQSSYCYEADPIQCSANEKDNPITFYAYEWVNPRWGKKIKEVNVYGTVKFQSTQRSGNPSTKPMPGNAIILGGISKVIPREPYIPK